MPQNNAALYGENKGAAQIIDTTSGAQQGFAQALARQQQQRQLELKQLTDRQAQLRPDGLRNDADRQDFFNQVADWTNKAKTAMNERDPYKKSLAQSQADQAYLQAQDLVNRSKQGAIKDNTMTQALLDNAKRHQYTDTAVADAQANFKRGVNDKNYISDYTALQRAPDLAGFDKRVKDLNDARLNNTQENYKLGPLTNIGNTQQTPITKYKQADAHAQALDYLNEATVNPDFANVLEKKYPQLYQGAQTEQQYHEAHALAAAQLAKDNVLYKDMGTTFTKNDETDADKAALHAKNRLFDAAHPTFSQVQSNLPTPIQQHYVEPMRNGGVPELDQFLSLADKGQFRATEKPTASVVNGYHVIHIPDQVTVDQKVAKANEAAKKGYADNKEYNDDAKHFWQKGTPKTFEESSQYTDPYKVVKPAEDISLDPTNKVDYYAKAGTIANRLHIPVGEVNNMAGGKGGRGTIPTSGKLTEPIKTDDGIKLSKPQKTIIKSSDIPSKAAALGWTIEEYTNLLKKQGIKIQ